MSGNEIVVRQHSVMQMSTVESIGAMAKLAAMSGLVKSSSKNVNQRIADAFVVMSYGVELGMKPMIALQNIHVINGKPSCSGQAMLAMMTNAGCEVQIPNPVDVTDSATIAIKLPGSDEWKEFTFTVAMAKKAGLWGSGTWGKYPEMMLIWRAVSMGGRLAASQYIGGMYTVEEIVPNAKVDEDGALIDFSGITEAAKRKQSFEPWPTIKKFQAYVQAIRVNEDSLTIKTKYGYVDVPDDSMFVEAAYLNHGELYNNIEVGDVQRFDIEQPLMQMERAGDDIIIVGVETVFDTYPPNDEEEQMVGHPEDPNEPFTGSGS